MRFVIRDAPRPFRRSRRAFSACILAAGLVAAAGVPAQPGAQTTDTERLRDLIRHELQRTTVSAKAAPDADAALPVPQIVGGHDAGPNDNPFQVALLEKPKSSPESNLDAAYCGGTLVRPNKVVTAAHCSIGLDPNLVSVLTGTRTLTNPGNAGTLRAVESIAVHPDYHRLGKRNDVAVWTLKSAATGIELATLADRPVANGTLMKTTGWGILRPGGRKPDKLQVVEVPKVARAVCNAPQAYDGRITESMLCAGFKQGRKDACQGDSGGPLTAGPNNRVLYGVTSWGFGCAEPYHYGVYARVADPAIRAFLERQISR
jgi:secreted trypsin-like serine protease